MDIDAGSSRNPTPLSVDQIHAVSNAVILEMTKHPSWSVPYRKRWVYDTHRDFWDTYPRLADICLNVRTFTDANETRRLIDMMLEEMKQMEDQSKGFDAASLVVGRNLGEKYIPNQNQNQ